MRKNINKSQNTRAVIPSIYYVDNMNGHVFEYFCADMLIKLGYTKVRVTKASGDNGVDIFAEHNGTTYAIQCKRYAQKVGNKAVQEAFSGACYYRCQQAIVITNNYFTDQAIVTARNLGVILWDRNFLNKMLRASYSDSEKAKKAIANSYYQAKTRKEASKKSSGCLWVIAIVLLFFVLITIINSLSP